MLMIFEGRWKIAAAITAAFLGLAGINIMISRATLDVSPLPVEETLRSPLAEGKATPSLPDFAGFELPQTLEKPIFSPTRRDFVEAPVEEPATEIIAEEVAETPAQEPVLDLPQIKLQGTRLVDGKRSALIAVGEGAAEWFGEGEDVAGWTVRSVTVDGVSLGAGLQSAAFSLYDGGKVGGTDE